MTDDKIFADASHRATLIYNDYENLLEGATAKKRTVECLTLQEAVIAFNNLYPANRNSALIHVGDQTYGPDEIERLHRKGSNS